MTAQEWAPGISLAQPWALCHILALSHLGRGARLSFLLAPVDVRMVDAFREGCSALSIYF